MNEQEKFFFTDEAGNQRTYNMNGQGKEVPMFGTDEKRLKCIELFLAYHSYYIAHDAPTDKDKKFVYLLFNGDREVYDASLNPEKYKDKIVWKVADDFEEGSDQRTWAENLKDTEVPLTGIMIQVNKLDSNEILYLSSYRTPTYALFTEVRLPWIIENKYKQPMVVFLSCFQKELFFDNGENNLNVDFYHTEEGYEPHITDEKKRSFILSQVASKVIEFEKLDIPENKVLLLDFKNGDRDVLSALAGTLRYKFYELRDVDDFSGEVFYDKIKSSKGPIVFYSRIPKSDKRIYFAVTSML